MEAPILTNAHDRDAPGPYPISGLVAYFCRDPANVLDAINFASNAYAAGNTNGARTYRRALSTYFWFQGDKARARGFA